MHWTKGVCLRVTTCLRYSIKSNVVYQIKIYKNCTNAQKRRHMIGVLVHFFSGLSICTVTGVIVI